MIFIKFDIWLFLEDLPRKFNLHRNRTAVHYMKTNIHFWYLAQFFSEGEMFQKNVADKIKTHILCLRALFLSSRCLWNNVEKYGKPRQATDENTRMPISC
jgi:hypothetical protein